jgi:hypothetical protein
MEAFKNAVRLIIWICGFVAQLYGTYFIFVEFNFLAAVAFFFIGGLVITIIMFLVSKVLGLAKDYMTSDKFIRWQKSQGQITVFINVRSN